MKILIRNIIPGIIVRIHAEEVFIFLVVTPAGCFANSVRDRLSIVPEPVVSDLLPPSQMLAVSMIDQIIHRTVSPFVGIANSCSFAESICLAPGQLLIKTVVSIKIRNTTVLIRS